MRAVMSIAQLALELPSYLVGAAGFEPATWSTQNSRATRLRYAPALSARLHGSVCASKLRFVRYSSVASHCRRSPDGSLHCEDLAPAEDRVCHPVARRNAKLLGGAGVHFKHCAHRATRGNERFRQRHRVLRNAQDAPVVADEDHVE